MAFRASSDSEPSGPTIAFLAEEILARIEFIGNCFWSMSRSAMMVLTRRRESSSS